MKNYFIGKRGDEMFLALLDNKPAGFLQLIIKEKELFIDLIGVDKIAQGRGVASSMIQFASKTLNDLVLKSAHKLVIFHRSNFTRNWALY